MTQREQELELLREEVEMLMAERQSMLQVVGAAAALIANLDSQRLPLGAVEAADILATVVNRLPEETLRDALDAVHAGTGKMLSLSRAAHPVG
jgi:hypothetical protein